MYSNGQKYIVNRKPPIGSLLNPYLLINQGLAGYWPFWCGAGDTVEDWSGNGNDGSITGATWVPGKFGCCLLFNGTTDKINLGNNPSITTVGDKLTISVWIYPTAAAGIRGIIGSSENGEGYGLSVEPTEIWMYAYGTSDVQWKGGSVPLNTWSHLVYVYDGVRKEVYMNGAYVGGEATTGDISVTSGYIQLGSWANAEFEGMIDCVTIYNRALSASEIALLCQEPFCGFRWTSLEQLATYYELPPEIKAIYADLSSQIWTIKHSTGLFTNL